MPDTFYNLVEWNSAMQLRNKEYHFCLLNIQISDNIDMDNIALIAQNLKEILRATDMLTRTNNQTIWIMLPNTPLNGCEIVVSKLLSTELINNHKIEDMMQVKSFASETLGKIDDAKRLFAELVNRG